MRHVLFMALSLLCASAQAQFDCLPETLITPPGVSTGSTTVEVETAAAEASAWWCPYFVDGNLKYQRNIRWSLKNRSTTYDWRAAYTRIKVAPNLLAAVNGELVATAVGTVPGTQDAYEVALIKHRACLALAVKPYLVPIIDLPVNWCGAPPVPPGRPAQEFRTPLSGTSLTIYRTSNSKIVSIVSGKKALAGATCSCTVSIPGVIGPYCPLPDSLPGEVTQCVSVP